MRKLVFALLFSSVVSAVAAGTHHIYVKGTNGGELLVLNVPGPVGDDFTPWSDSAIQYIEAVGTVANWTPEQIGEVTGNGIGGVTPVKCTYVLWEKLNPQPGEPRYKCEDTGSDCEAPCNNVAGGTGSATLNLNQY